VGAAARRETVFQTFYAYQNFLRRARAPAGNFRPVPRRNPGGRIARSEYDFGMEVYELDAAFKVKIKFEQVSTRPATVERMMHEFVHLLRTCVSAPDARCSRHALVPPKIRRIERYWSQPAGSAPRHQEGIGAHFSEQVERYPDKVALTCGAQNLTYRRARSQGPQLGPPSDRARVRTESASACACIARSIWSWRCWAF